MRKRRRRSKASASRPGGSTSPRSCSIRASARIAPTAAAAISVSAARVAVWIAWDSAAFRGEEGVAKGWLQRARRLLDGQPDSAEHAFLAARAAVFALLDDGDPEAAEALAAEAIRVGQAIGAIDYEMVGRALHGFALVTTGRVTEGLRELDEVSAAILAGELTRSSADLRSPAVT